MKNLFFNHYQSETRQHEIDLCLRMNQKVFDNVIIVEGRPTFSELFVMSKPDDINVYCNSDIYFPDTSLLDKIGEGECWALSRYNLHRGKPVLFERSDSQDSWVFRGVVKNVEANFTQKLWGTDNRLAYEIQKAGYIITNPSHTIQTIHIHADNSRDHVRTADNVVPPPYLTLPPTNLKNI